MNWLVTGGTGFIGKALLEKVEARGDRAVVLSRDARGREPPLGPRVVAWTPKREGPWMDEVSAVDVVVHLAGAAVMDARWTADRKNEIRASRVRSTELLAGAIAKASTKPRVFVSASAVGIYGARMVDDELDEAASHGDDFLATVCEAWEAAADAARAANVRVVHPRIGVVLGRGGGAFEEMARPFRAFVGGPLGSGRQWVSWIHLDDAVNALLFAVDHASLTGPFNVTAPTPARQKDVARALGAAMHRPALLPAPAAALRVALGARAEIVLTGQRAVPKKLLEAGFRFAHPDLGETLRALV